MKWGAAEAADEQKPMDEDGQEAKEEEAEAEEKKIMRQTLTRPQIKNQLNNYFNCMRTCEKMTFTRLLWKGVKRKDILFPQNWLGYLGKPETTFETFSRTISLLSRSVPLRSRADRVPIQIEDNLTDVINIICSEAVWVDASSNRKGDCLCVYGFASNGRKEPEQTNHRLHMEQLVQATELCACVWVHMESSKSRKNRHPKLIPTSSYFFLLLIQSG